MQKTVAAKGRRTYLTAARIATHFPRRRSCKMSILWRLNARVTSRSCPRKIPERISQRAAFSFGKISISNSLNRFAVTMSTFRGDFQRRTSPTQNCTLLILFSRAFSFAVEIAIGSLSIPITRVAPKHFAASARIPLPVPRSTIDQPGFQLRVSFSSNRSDIAVVACSPVPKALPAGIKMWEAPFGGDHARRARIRDAEVPPTLVITSRFPTLSGLVFREDRLSQSPGSFSTRPPNCVVRFCNSVRERDATSSCNRLRSALSIIANRSLAIARNSFSLSLHHF